MEQHLSQIFRSLNYRVLGHFEDLKGKTVVGVFQVGWMQTAIITEGAILFVDMDNNDYIEKEMLSAYNLAALEKATGITADQLL